MASFQQQQQSGLVGRPLVPYFDADENVNAALEAARGSEFEQMEVDARVWNKELGYFEYPSDQPAASAADAGSSAHGASAPIAIPGKVLLTPAMMLSNSCPETSFMTAASHPSSSNNDTQPVTTSAAPARSSSAKRASKSSKSRSNTPVRRRNEDTQASTATTAATTAAATSKKGKNKQNNSAPSSSNASQKQKTELSASGKWAWSAFQSSPDPKQLPLPPFLAAPGSSPPVNASPGPPLAPPPMDLTSVAQPERPPPPTVPPENAMSLELSMTQDLRRMLNIGGG